jgi:hypothetical protein
VGVTQRSGLTVAQVNTSRDDLVELSEFAFSRLRRRMGGLTDEEYLWEPVANCRTIRPLADGSYVWDTSIASGPSARPRRRRRGLALNEVEGGPASPRVPGGQVDPQA